MSNFLFNEHYDNLKPLQKRTFKGQFFISKSDYEYEKTVFKFQVSFYKDEKGTIDLPIFSYKTPSTIVVKYWPIDYDCGGHKFINFSLDNIVIPNEAKCMKIEALAGGNVVINSVSFPVISDSR